MGVTFLNLIIWMAPLSLFAHELGHVMMARLCRAEQSEIRIGTGRELFALVTGRMRVQVGWIFFHGAHSVNTRKQEFNRFEKAMISVGGPLINSGCAALIMLTPLHDLSRQFVILGWFNVYLTVINLIPFSLKGKKSDGYTVWKALCS
ncbi:hypothetical protein EQV77_02670 [Halobacillus fulvus]|nr:hypothetical protein EQV77_02670 [Halobacillus fulvus]